jgi:hypothetical protein
MKYNEHHDYHHPKREEVVGCWRRLHSEALHNLYASPNTVRVIKSKRMR